MTEVLFAPHRLRWAHPLRRNPLMRPSDRARATTDLVVAALMAAAIPVAGAIGTTEYSHALVAVQQADATKVAVEATVITAPSEDGSYGSYGSFGDWPHQWRATVQWPQEGQLRQATVDVPQTATKSGKTTVWVDADGKPTTPPVPTSAAAYDGVVAGVMILLAGWALLLSFDWAVRQALDALNRRNLAREWRAISAPMQHDR